MGVIASEKGPSLTPAAASDKARVIRPGFLNDEIRFVGDQLSIYAEHSSERGLKLRRRIIIGLKNAHGLLDQVADGSHIGQSGKSEI